MTRRALAGGALLLLALTGCGADDSGDSRATTTTPASPSATSTAPAPSTGTPASPSSPSGGATQGFFSGSQLDACQFVTSALLQDDLGVNPGRAGHTRSGLGEDPGSVLGCLYTGDVRGGDTVVVRATLHADRDLPASSYAADGHAEAIPGADRGWVELYGLGKQPQARVLLVKGQVGFEIDISSENGLLDVEDLQTFAQDLLSALA